MNLSVSLILPAIGFLLGALFTDFLKWRSDVRALRTEKLEEILDGIAACRVFAIEMIESRGQSDFQNERTRAMHTESLVYIYVPEKAELMAEALKAFWRFEQNLRDASAKGASREQDADGDFDASEMGKYVTGFYHSLIEVRTATIAAHRRVTRWLPF